ncbi:MAG: hypothetical protein HZB20_08325 [Chloroflexi bacterium]|nr:hypothetical protein [Chloroflexota bacterium]
MSYSCLVEKTESKHQVERVALAQHAAPPVVDERHDEWQQAQAVLGRQDGQAQQIAEADEHKQVLEAAALAGERAHLIVQGHAVQNLGQGEAEAPEGHDRAA